MTVLALRTDGQESTISLFKQNDCIISDQWVSGRDLGRELLSHIVNMLTNVGSNLLELEGIVCFAGPGSFTSLRIGITTANTLAYACEAPIISETGENWLEKALERLSSGENEKIVKPEYGSEPHITPAKK